MSPVATVNLIVAASLLAFALTTPPALAKSPKSEKIQFASANPEKTELSGHLYRPKGDGPFTAIVMLHGCGGMLTPKKGYLKKREKFWANWLVAREHLVLLADSFNPRGFRSICKLEKRPVQPYRERPFDAYGALTYLQARDDVRPDQIVLMGWSNGAMTALWTIRAGAQQRPDGLAHDFRAAIAFYPGCVKLYKSDYVTWVPTLLQLGGSDDWTRPKPCLKLVKQAVRNGSSITADVHDGAYHGFDHPSSKVRTVTTRNSVYKSGEKQAHVGSNHAARDAALRNVAVFLDTHLGQ